MPSWKGSGELRLVLWIYRFCRALIGVEGHKGYQIFGASMLFVNTFNSSFAPIEFNI